MPGFTNEPSTAEVEMKECKTNKDNDNDDYHKLVEEILADDDKQDNLESSQPSTDVVVNRQEEKSHEQQETQVVALPTVSRANGFKNLLLNNHKNIRIGTSIFAAGACFGGTVAVGTSLKPNDENLQRNTIITGICFASGIILFLLAFAELFATPHEGCIYGNTRRLREEPKDDVIEVKAQNSSRITRL